MENHPHNRDKHPPAGGKHRSAQFHGVTLREMTGKEIDHLMETASSGRLGTMGPDGPYIVPMAFAWHKGTVFFHCHRAGKKLENIEGDNRVCFQVDTHTPDTMSYQSVIIMGKARLVESEEAMVAMKSMMKKYSSGMKMPDKSGMARLVKVYKITDANITGKFSTTGK